MQLETLLISLCRLKALSGLGIFWADPSARLWRQQGSWCLPEAIRKQLYPDCKVFHWICSQTRIILWFLFVTDEVGWSRAIQMQGILFWAFSRVIHLLLLLLNPKWRHIAALHLCTSLDHNNHCFEKELRVFNDCLMTVRATAWWSPDSGGVGKAVPPQGHANSSNFLPYLEVTPLPLNQYTAAGTGTAVGLRNTVYPHLFSPYSKIQTAFAEVYLDLTGVPSSPNRIKYQ